jgi:hypothetical protein
MLCDCDVRATRVRQASCVCVCVCVCDKHQYLFHIARVKLAYRMVANKFIHSSQPYLLIMYTYHHKTCHSPLTLNSLVDNNALSELWECEKCYRLLPSQKKPFLVLSEAECTLYNVSLISFVNVRPISAQPRNAKINYWLRHFFVCTHGTTRLPLFGFLWHKTLEHFSKISRKIQVSLQSDTNSQHFTQRRIYIHNISLIVSLNGKFFRQ